MKRIFVFAAVAVFAFSAVVSAKSTIIRANRGGGKSVSSGGGGGGSGDVVLVATQTLSGQNTFKGLVTVSTTLLVNDGSNRTLFLGATNFTFCYNAGGGSTTCFSIQGNGSIYQNGILLTNFKEVNFPIYSFKLSSGMNSSPAGLVSGATYFGLNYSPAVANTAQIQWKMPVDYSSSSVIFCDLDYTITNAVVSGNVQLDVAFSTSVIRSFDNINTLISAVPTVANEKKSITIPIVTKSGLGGGDWFRMKIDVNPAATTVAGSSVTVIGARLKYQ